MRLGWNKLFDTYRDVIRELRGTHFFKTLALTSLLLILATWGMYMAEFSQNGEGRGFLDSLWWAVVTLTTVGYGDIVPKTITGRVIGFVIMASGIFLVSLMTASIASVFVSRKIKEGKGLEDVHDRDHIVICGWNENGLPLIDGLSKQFAPKVPVIVLVNELPREDIDAVLYHFPSLEFRYVRGNFTKEEVLARANVRWARAAVILSDTTGMHSAEKADERTIFGCLAIKSLAPQVRTCAELRNPENREHLNRAHVDEIVVRGEYNASILSGAATAPGLSTVMKRLLDMGEPNQLWKVKVPERMLSRNVGELTEYYQKKYSAILIAVVTETKPMQLEDILSSDATAIDTFIKRKFEESGKDYFSKGKEGFTVQINPPFEYILTRQDSAIVLGRTKPG